MAVGGKLISGFGHRIAGNEKDVLADGVDGLFAEELGVVGGLLGKGDLGGEKEGSDWGEESGGMFSRHVEHSRSLRWYAAGLRPLSRFRGNG
jgi:hypothetical protein